MEIIFEALVWLAQLLLEMALQVVLEILGEVGIHSLKEPFWRPKPIHPAFAALGYAIYGAIAGAISLWLFPIQFIEAQWLRVTNLLLTPVVAGVVMGAIGAWRTRRGGEVLRLDSFAYGFLFALTMAGVRFIWGN